MSQAIHVRKTIHVGGRSWTVGELVRVLAPGSAFYRHEAALVAFDHGWNGFVVRFIDGHTMHFSERDLEPVGLFGIPIFPPAGTFVSALEAEEAWCSRNKANTGQFLGFCEACGGLRTHRLMCPKDARERQALNGS